MEKNLNELVGDLKEESKGLDIGRPSYFFGVNREGPAKDFYGIVFSEFDRKTKNYVDFLLRKIDLGRYNGMLDVSYLPFEREDGETGEVVSRTHALSVKPSCNLTKAQLSDLLITLIKEIKHETRNYKKGNR